MTAGEQILVAWWLMACQELVENGQLVVDRPYSQDSTEPATVNNLVVPTGAQP